MRPVVVHPRDRHGVGVVRGGGERVVVVALSGEGRDPDVGGVLHRVGPVEVEARVHDREEQEEQQAAHDGELDQALPPGLAAPHPPDTRMNRRSSRSAERGCPRHLPVHPKSVSTRSARCSMARCEELVANGHGSPIRPIAGGLHLGRPANHPRRMWLTTSIQSSLLHKVLAEAVTQVQLMRDKQFPRTPGWRST